MPRNGGGPGLASFGGNRSKWPIAQCRIFPFFIVLKEIIYSLFILINLSSKCAVINMKNMSLTSLLLNCNWPTCWTGFMERPFVLILLFLLTSSQSIWGHYKHIFSWFNISHLRGLFRVKYMLGFQREILG